MKFKKTILISIFIFLGFKSHIIAQANLDSLKIAEAYLDSENFTSAISFYQRFLMQMPNDPELNFKMGFSLLNTPDRKEESIAYFKKSTKAYRKKMGKKSVKYIESYFYLSRAYRSSYQFDVAIEMFNELLERVTSINIIREINKELTLCHNGITLTKNKRNVEVKNMEDEINSNFADFCPLISADGNTLVFTSRRENTSGGEADMDGQFDEDIFISTKDGSGKWTTPKGISKNINTSEHEVAVGLSADGQQLLIYKSEDEGSIFLSKKQGDQWSVPKKLGLNINTPYKETHASFSNDGKQIYFTSNRPGGKGHLDIYVSNLQDDNTWGKAINLGDAINTELNETSPHISSDDKTLFFSSKGHLNMGGYDIFMSPRNEKGDFTKGQNIGYPINTVQDDVYYNPIKTGEAYFSSKRAGGKGNSDIYLVRHLESR